MKNRIMRGLICIWALTAGTVSASTNGHTQEEAVAYNGYASYDYLYGSSDDTYVYQGGAGKWGHMETYNFKKNNDYSSWGWGGTPSGEEYYAPTSLDNTLYKKINGSYVAMYKAVEASSLYGNAWERFKIAWKGESGTDYTGSSYPDNLYAFCDWGGESNSEGQWYGASSVAYVDPSTGNRSEYNTPVID